MALVNSSGFAHARLVVTDIDRSKAFYDQVFGWPVAIDFSNDKDPEVRTDQERFYGGCVYTPAEGQLLGLRPVGAEDFDADVTGLDHISFYVESRDALVAAASAFDEAGIAHGEVVDLEDAGIAFLSFQDPDDINLELTAPL